MASDSSESPLVLTPDSTGTGVGQMDSSPDSSATSSGALKKSRRQTAFYPNMNAANKPLKPFSRSAAKRESVMALGSIEHLQHFFTKTGLASKKKPMDKPHLGLVPAIGGKGHVPHVPSASSQSDFTMPPSPIVPDPPKPLYSRHVKSDEADPESLLPGVIEDLISVAQAWKLETKRDTSIPEFDLPFDILDVLKTTTRAIRSTRNYLLSLPDESPSTIRAQVQFNSRVTGPRPRGPTSAPNNAATATPSSSSSSLTASADPAAHIRRSALEVLTVLRQLEENCRLPLDDEAYDAQSDGGHSRGAGSASSPSNGPVDLPPDVGNRSEFDPDMSVSFSLVQVQGQMKSVPVWEDEEDVFALEREEEKEKKDGWERLVLGSGYLYKQDIQLSHLEKERQIVSSYLNIVDEVLFEGKPAGTLKAGDERGWDRVRRQREGRASSRATSRARNMNRRVSASESEGGNTSVGPTDSEVGRRRVSTGMVNLMGKMGITEEPDNMEDINEDGEDLEEVEEGELPEWAKRTTFMSDQLGRVHSLFAYFLPSDLLPSLGPPNSRTTLLHTLSSGQLLCIAYNACVRKSKQPWGFVSKDSIHDIIALEKAALASGEDESGKKVWTFRRTDNIRLWVGALKLRYLLPISMTSQLLPSGTSRPGSNANTPATSPSAMMQKFTFPIRPNQTTPIIFDAKVVAKKEDGWEDMLENVLFRWMEKVVDERRLQHR
ncbi:hypothetical protein CPB83DRAFT_851602 [Crepidotus variabilis]|uniref:Uncharacterized protein n=1 Tax=Crepidotus variabilis TaxID=179855 RepID=A0A9P6EI65_9AGAR|nr:hypothetical protein CPB83DRAFT_851602 [Crepidotus variabilis]